MSTVRWLIGVTAVIVVAAGGFPSQAGPLDQRILAVAFEYQPAEVTLHQDEPLEFTNLDVAPHDVTALDAGPDGLPVFASETVGTGVTTVVEGLDDLAPGVYDFTCTLHPSMLGTLYLEAASG